MTDYAPMCDNCFEDHDHRALEVCAGVTLCPDCRTDPKVQAYLDDHEPLEHVGGGRWTRRREG